MKHNEGQIVLPFNWEASLPNHGGFARVPNWVLSLELSAQARLFLAWAIGHWRPPHSGATWIPRVDDIKKTLGLGDKKWRRLVDELEPLGVIVQSSVRRSGSTKHSLIIDLTPLWSPQAREALAQLGAQRQQCEGSQGAEPLGPTISAAPKCSGLHAGFAGGEVAP